MFSFAPPRLLRNRHIQTIGGSSGRRLFPPRTSALQQSERTETITTSEGVRLAVRLNEQQDPAPMVMLIHGWLGCDRSTYLCSAAAALHTAGFSTARINLRDHGDTEHLNEQMFHSARIREIIDLANALAARPGTRGFGVAGYSLGGNFALRVAIHTDFPALAICPAVDPAATMHQIDHGSAIYRAYFVRKWQRNLAAKQRAFPDLYDFSKTQTLRSVSAMTDYFVRHHTDFASSADYFDAYSVAGQRLKDANAAIVYCADDPVITEAQFTDLPASVPCYRLAHGGHMGFVSNLRLDNAIDVQLVSYFSALLRSGACS